jgi:hypothetical protein
MLAADSENFCKQFGCSVRYEILFSEYRRAVDQHRQLDDLPDLIEIADSEIQRRQQVDCYIARSYCSELRGEICAKLSQPGFAVLSSRYGSTGRSDCRYARRGRRLRRVG